MFHQLSYSIRHYMKLFYCDGSFPDYESQTDYDLNVVMNRFIHYNKGRIKSGSLFVLESQNDVFTVIAYKMLKMIQLQYPFKLAICGKTNQIKDYVYDEEKISYFTMRRKRKEITVVTCFNPLYDVETVDKKFKISRSLYFYCYDLIEHFTIEQFKYLYNFFNVGNYLLLSEISALMDSTLYKIQQNSLKETDDLNYKLPPIIEDNFDLPHWHLFKLTGDLKKDALTYDRAINYCGLAFYDCGDADPNEIWACKAGRHFKYRDNAPNEFNIKQLNPDIDKFMDKWSHLQQDVPKINVIVTNGFPASGKTTMQTIFQRIAKENNKQVNITSMVDFVKEIAELIGWKKEKTPEARNMLSELKDLMSKYNDSPYQDVRIKLGQWNRDGIDFVFIDSREPDDIKRLKEEFNAVTVFVKRDDNGLWEENVNHADADVLSIEYDYIIDNTGSLKDLEEETQRFYDYLCETNTERGNDA